MYKLIKFSEEEFIKDYSSELRKGAKEAIEELHKMFLPCEKFLVKSSDYPVLLYFRFAKLEYDENLAYFFGKVRQIEDVAGIFQFVAVHDKEGYLESFGTLFYMDFIVDELGTDVYEWSKYHDHLRLCANFIAEGNKELE